MFGHGFMRSLLVQTDHQTISMLPCAFLTVAKSPGTYGTSLAAALFLQPPDFIAHAFPEVDALGGGPMALHIVPPGHGLGGTAKHDTRYFPVQELDAPGNQRFEFHGV